MKGPEQTGLLANSSGLASKAAFLTIAAANTDATDGKGA